VFACQQIRGGGPQRRKRPPSEKLSMHVVDMGAKRMGAVLLTNDHRTAARGSGRGMAKERRHESVVQSALHYGTRVPKCATNIPPPRTGKRAAAASSEPSGSSPAPRSIKSMAFRTVVSPQENTATKEEEAQKAGAQQAGRSKST
jgi:hypothetical protein